MKIYDFPLAPNPRRVRIFLAEKNIEMVYVHIDIFKGENQTAEFIEKNPLGKLPVLEFDDGTYLTESVAICRYFEGMYPNPPLMGVDPRDIAFVEMWNRRMELEIFLPMVDVFVHCHPFWIGKREQIPAYGELLRRQVIARMQWLDGELAQRPYIAGDTYGIADITAQVALLTARGALKLPIPEEQKNLTRWWAAVSARPSARA